MLEGHIENGKVVLDEPHQLAEGTPVRIETVVAGNKITKKKQSLLELLGPLVGSITDLPKDASQQVDHYLYGTPKR